MLQVEYDEHHQVNGLVEHLQVVLQEIHVQSLIVYWTTEVQLLIWRTTDVVQNRQDVLFANTINPINTKMEILISTMLHQITI